MKKTHIAIVIPVYNEEYNINNAFFQIGQGIRKFPKNKFTIIAVDDASSDNSYREMIKASHKYKLTLKIQKNLNNVETAQSTKIGFQKALSLKADYALKMDADRDFPQKQVIEQLTPYIFKSKNFLRNKLIIGIRKIDKTTQMTPYEKTRKNQIDAALKKYLCLENYGPASAGTQLYPIKLLKKILEHSLVINYKKKWGLDVLLALLFKKLNYKLIIVPILNGEYNPKRRNYIKVKNQYNEFESIIMQVLDSNLVYHKKLIK